jgi:pyruvate/2-oxoglutarate dehydrogenase complex dihydrolipoamide dehydrogenase (E3) component
MKVVVLGAGVAGESFVAAFRREDPEVEITLVERELVGGECSYWACIPSKTMLRPLELAFHGRSVPPVRDPEFDVAEIFAWRDQVAGQDDTGQAEWVTGLDVELIRGEAEVAETGLVRVGSHEVPYDELVIATGSLPSFPPLEGLDDVGAWSSREGTTASEIPPELVIVGGGAVGCELAQFYARVGSRVTLVQGAPVLLERIDAEAGELLAGTLAEDGVDVRVGTRPTSVERAGGRIRLGCEGGGVEIEGTHLLIATGRRPNVEGFGFERLPIEIEKRGVQVDDRLRAGEQVWAAGDVTGVALFTHVGKYQARIAAANIAGREMRADYRATPAAIFTDPQIASVGDTTGEGAVTSKWSIEGVSRASTYAKPK